MTHIRGSKEYWSSTFASYSSNENGELILHLSDRTTRKMENWGKDTNRTRQNLDELQPGDLIEVITGGGLPKEKWFCDVKKLNKEY